MFDFSCIDVGIPIYLRIKSEALPSLIPARSSKCQVHHCRDRLIGRPREVNSVLEIGRTALDIFRALRQTPVCSEESFRAAVPKRASGGEHLRSGTANRKAKP
jgi:hypothetical protein